MEPATPIPTGQPTGRFSVGKGVVRLDAAMGGIIRVGGVSVIAAVFAIFLFILAQVLPLFGRAKVGEATTVPMGVTSPVAMGVDDWGERPFVLGADGTVVMLGAEGTPERLETPLPEGFVISQARYDQASQAVALGSVDGRLALLKVNYKAVFGEGGARSIEASLAVETAVSPVPIAGEIVDLAVHETDTQRLVAAIVKDDAAGTQAWVASESRRRSLIGRPQLRRDWAVRIDAEGPAATRVLVNASAGRIVALGADGQARYFQIEGGALELRQTWRVLEPGRSATAFEFLLGRAAIVVVDDRGGVSAHAIYRDEKVGALQFTRTKNFEGLGAGASFFAASPRNRAFLVGTTAGDLRLDYSTTEAVRWRGKGGDKVLGLIGGKYDSLLFLDVEGVLHRMPLHDPHPEAGLRAFFGKIWYEGQPGPAWTWQSTGGSQEFEPKLSLVPLMWGSLKGTIYALVFAVPVALLAAVYTSQFLRPSLRRWIKPVMEIMASLPSVVLGFIGALWLAPRLADRVPSALMILLGVPLIAVLVGWAWGRLPARFRILLPNGLEFLCFGPVFLVAAWGLWELGPWVERLVFTLPDPTTGAPIADFRLWWQSFTGTAFEQRNSMVVGFMMGFAVIPLIFTISEDALSNVPSSLTSGSLALGASRWQTAWKVVVPMASAGIFSALMIGFGRAVGETMIVVMASGNTPILELNVFSGMRPLSANIAVELPEAPHGGTLYRTLFLGAFVLFVLTFAVNTVAEVLRHRLREKYRHV